MSQKPVHEKGYLATRQAVWNEIRRMQRFTVTELRAQTCLGMATVREYVIGLTQAGYLECLGVKELPPGSPRRSSAIKQPAEYQLVRDTGIDPPRVRKDGSEITQGQDQERMWRVMRILKEFSVVEIIATTSTDKTIPIQTVKAYINVLFNAGYLARISETRQGNQHAPTKLARFRLLPYRNTGPKPPMVQRSKDIFDQNLGKIVWRKGENK